MPTKRATGGVVKNRATMKATSGRTARKNAAAKAIAADSTATNDMIKIRPAVTSTVAQERPSELRNYLIKVRLCPGYINGPPIWRTLSIPADSTFSTVHEALQIAFGWVNEHAYSFDVSICNYHPDGSDDSSDERMARESARRQIAIVCDDLAYGMMEDLSVPEKRASTTTIQQIIQDNRDIEIMYKYDFGDGWQHYFEILRRETATKHIRCTDGHGHGPAEDSGGVGGWLDLLEAYQSRRPNAEQRYRKTWFETMAANADARGLANGGALRWDKDAINADLERLP